MSSPLAYISTNCTLLASSSPPIVKVTESTTDTNLKTGMEADAMPVKKTYAKLFIYTMNLHLNMHLNILTINGQIPH